jgi:hypothetical protein
LKTGKNPRKEMTDSWWTVLNSVLGVAEVKIREDALIGKRVERARAIARAR